MMFTPRIVVVRGDITRLSTDIIVNAANPAMLGGGGVDGAIHRAAGPELRVACAKFPTNDKGERCPTGECRLTLGYNLPATYVIHTVGPDLRDNFEGDLDRASYQLGQCYTKCMALGNGLGMKSIAFPMISCGVYGFDPMLASSIAVQAIQLSKTSMTVYLVAFSDEDHRILLDAVENPHRTSRLSELMYPITRWLRSRIHG